MRISMILYYLWKFNLILDLNFRYSEDLILKSSFSPLSKLKIFMIFNTSSWYWFSKYILWCQKVYFTNFNLNQDLRLISYVRFLRLDDENIFFIRLPIIFICKSDVLMKKICLSRVNRVFSLFVRMFFSLCR